MTELLIRLLKLTAWRMTQPQPYSAFHLYFSFIGGFLAVFLAWKLRGKQEHYQLRLLFLLGLLLAFSEGYKQLFLTLIVGHGTYDWWYFPFQLCSLPMYFCLILPFLPASSRQVLYTFMYSYNLPGAILVFVWPDGLMHPYWTLTIHAFLWHILLIFLGFYAVFSGNVPSSVSTFQKATALFLGCCGIATLVNVLAIPKGSADMFYISPYEPTPQPVFSILARHFGIWIGNLASLGAIIFGAWLMFKIYIKVSSVSRNVIP